MTTLDPGDIAKHHIYKEIRRAIIVGRLEPGDRLVMSDLATAYETSVTPVRDALQMLSQEGLVTIKPRSGYFVTRITLKELRELLELREIIEVAAIERAATRINSEQIHQLKNIHAGYSGDDDESYERYTYENKEFHCLIAEASGNHELAKLVASLHDKLARFMVLRHAGKSMLDSHATIVKALKTGDHTAARQAMLDEVVDTRERILEHVIYQDGGAWHLGS